MTQYDYDLFVIGAGSGGVRAARLTALGGESMSEADRIIREVLDTTGKAMGVEQREQMYASLRTILNTLREI